MDRKSHKRVHIMVMGTSDVFKVVFQVLPWISSQHFHFLELKSCYWLHCIHTTICKSLKWLLNCLNHWFEPISENLVRTKASGKLLTLMTQKKKGESWSYLQLNDNDFTLVLTVKYLRKLVDRRSNDHEFQQIVLKFQVSWN